VSLETELVTEMNSVVGVKDRFLASLAIDLRFSGIVSWFRC
jgi:hypothetical protein